MRPRDGNQSRRAARNAPKDEFWGPKDEFWGAVPVPAVSVRESPGAVAVAVAVACDRCECG